MAEVLPPAHAFYNGIAHSIFAYKGTKPVTDERREELRAEYRAILDRAKEVTAHRSGWVRMMDFGSKADSKRAEEINNEMFISGPCPAYKIPEALALIFGD
jgi:hypothetical protein